MVDTPVFEDFVIGQAIAPLHKGRITTAHIMRWSASVENWHRIHYDQAFATGHDGLPDVVINGSWKQHILVQLMKDTLDQAAGFGRSGFVTGSLMSRANRSRRSAR